jgi:hypothetical protein
VLCQHVRGQTTSPKQRPTLFSAMKRQGKQKKTKEPKGSLPAAVNTPTVLKSKQSVGPIYTMDLPFQLNTAAVATGAMALNLPMDKASIPNFSTRFGSTFQEYRIVGTRIKIRPINISAGQGYAIFAIDEKSSSAPTLANMQNRPHVEIVLPSTFDGNAALNREIQWIAHDLLDLQFTAIGTDVDPLYLLAFASVAGTLTSASTTATFEVSAVHRIQFRGLQ